MHFHSHFLPPTPTLSEEQEKTQHKGTKAQRSGKPLHGSESESVSASIEKKKTGNKPHPILNLNSDLNLNLFPVIPFCLALALSAPYSNSYSSRREGDSLAKNAKSAKGRQGELSA